MMLFRVPSSALALAMATLGICQSPALCQIDRPTSLKRSDAQISIDAPIQPPPKTPLETPPPPIPGNATVIQMEAPPQAPSELDISSGRFGRLDIDLVDAKFSEASVDKLHLTATDMDLKASTLKSLAITVNGGHFQEFIFDQFTLNTQGDLNFDSSLLLNDKVLQFSTPAEANVTAVVNQESLNAFLSSPITLEKLSVQANKRVGMLATMLGANASNFGITLSGANVSLLKQNRVSITTNANVGMGGVGVPLPLELNGKLGLENGWIAVSDTHLNTNGQEISPQLSEMLVKKINGLASWGTKSNDIQFSFTDLKVIAGKQFILKGTAKINRLRFGKQKVEVPAG